MKCAAITAFRRKWCLFGALILTFGFIDNTRATPHTQLVAPANGYDHLGYSVDISGDWMIVGAPFYDVGSTYPGKIFIYEYINELWYLDSSFDWDGQATNATLGWSVAIDGEWAVAGAPHKVSVYGVGASGAVRLYKRTSEGWIMMDSYEIQIVFPNNGNYFGWDVDISGDFVIVGEPAWGTSDGQASMFEIVNDQLTLHTDLSPLCVDKGRPRYTDAFGASVAIKDNHAIVGDPMWCYGFGSGIYNCISGYNVTGAVWFYNYNTQGEWAVKQACVPPPDWGVGYSADFGKTVALDGNIVEDDYYAVVAGDRTQSNAEMKLSFFEKVVVGKRWQFVLKDEEEPDVSMTASFGDSLALAYGDPSCVLVGDPGYDSVKGIVVKYCRHDKRGKIWWEDEQTWEAYIPDIGDQYGRSVAYDGSRILIGAERWDGWYTWDTDEGALYFYR